MFENFCLELTVLLYLLSYKNLLNPTRDATNALPLKSRILKVLRLGCVLCCSTFNFSVPFISHLAIILLILISILLYYVSVRYLAIAWGINKFLRKILRPHTVPNNELLDLLSRVPDNEQLRSYRELKAQPSDTRSRDQRKKLKDR
uniref:Multiple C2 and transmembrane domain-containing protein 1 n=1 Tax=Cacopsylla melanoneura TaxID=428564 RepID=A0A8D8TWA2_9HEMI